MPSPQQPRPASDLYYAHLRGEAPAPPTKEMWSDALDQATHERDREHRRALAAEAQVERLEGELDRCSQKGLRANAAEALNTRYLTVIRATVKQLEYLLMPENPRPWQNLSSAHRTLLDALEGKFALEVERLTPEEAAGLYAAANHPDAPEAAREALPKLREIAREALAPYRETEE